MTCRERGLVDLLSELILPKRGMGVILRELELVQKVDLLSCWIFQGAHDA